MDITPSQVTGATFRTVRKGYDPDEVHAFLSHVAAALEEAQQQATAMEARARAAVARLQEVSAERDATHDDSSSEAPTAPIAVVDRVEHVDDGEVHVTPDEAETISRTLLLAQRTADTTVAEAEADAERIKLEARSEAETTIDSTRDMSAKLLEEARTEARKASEGELRAAENEVESLKARREFLVGDVGHLETFLDDQRERLRAAAHQIEALCDRVPAGLAPVPSPALSASDDEPGDDTAELFLPAEAAGPFATIDELASTLDGVEASTFERPSDEDSRQESLDIAPEDAPDLPTRNTGATPD